MRIKNSINQQSAVFAGDGSSWRSLFWLSQVRPLRARPHFESRAGSELGRENLSRVAASAATSKQFC